MFTQRKMPLPAGCAIFYRNRVLLMLLPSVVHVTTRNALLRAYLAQGIPQARSVLQAVTTVCRVCVFGRKALRESVWVHLSLVETRSV